MSSNKDLSPEQMQRFKNRLTKIQDEVIKKSNKKTFSRLIKSLRASGGGGGSIKSPDETARGRMSLLKKKQM